MARRSHEREQFLADILITAVEGGTGYWAAVSGYDWSDEEPATTRVTLHEVNDDETAYDGAQHQVTIDVIATGVHRALDRETRVNQTIRESIAMGHIENDGGYIDSDAADVIVQLAVLGEITYG